MSEVQRVAALTFRTALLHCCIVLHGKALTQTAVPVSLPLLQTDVIFGSLEFWGKDPLLTLE